MNISNRKIRWLNIALLAVLLGHSLYRDIQLERQFTADIRNRIIGARLQEEHKLPYTYNWKISDGTRYYDINRWKGDSLGPSNITASPFFHQLLIPICDLPQKTISKIWLILEYLSLFLIVFLAIRLTPDNSVKWAILNIGVLFTVTEAWKIQVYTGQIYIYEGLLISFIIAALARNKKLTIAIAGLLAAVFVLTRPIGIVIFIPCLFYWKRSILFLGVAIATLVGYGIFVITNPNQKALYQNYVTGMQMQVKVHQTSHQNNGVFAPLTFHAEDSVGYDYYEGIDEAELKRQVLAHPVKVYSETGNFFVVYTKLTGHKLSVNMLSLISAGLLLILSAVFLWKSKSENTGNVRIIFFGFLLYMIADIASPVFRHQYNTVQWFPLILTALIALPDWKNPIFSLIILGLALNIVNFTWLPMRHTVGEYCWLLALLLLSFSNRFKFAS